MHTPSQTDKYTTQTITQLRAWVPEKLFSFRATRDQGFRFAPGQFARLGVPVGDDIVWRAYSMASANYDDFLEFYSIVVPDGAFTSQLHRLRVGDPIYIEKNPYGFLTTSQFVGGQTLWLISSGTGIAPFISILFDLSIWEQYQKIVLVHCVREANELAYRQEILALKDHPYFGEFLQLNPQQLSYVPIVTREHIDGCLTHRIQHHIADGSLEAAAKADLDPEQARVMLCGNPQMLKDLRQQLATLGFKTTRRGIIGNLLLENYW